MSDPTSTAPAADVAAALQTIESAVAAGPVLAAGPDLDAWVARHIQNTAISQDTAAWNTIEAAVAQIKSVLHRFGQ